MAADDGTVQIRSFRVCFDLERRIHKIDRWRIPLPYGLPLRGIAYFAAVILLTAVLTQLPVAGALLSLIHPALRYVVMPAGAAYVLSQWKIDGRLPHATASAWLRMRLEPARICAFRPAPPLGRVHLGAVTVAPDGYCARLRRGVVEGPADVVIRYPAATVARGRTLRLSQESERPMWRGKQVRLRAGQRLVVR